MESLVPGRPAELSATGLSASDRIVPDGDEFDVPATIIESLSGTTHFAGKDGSARLRDLIWHFDWAATSLGPAESWSPLRRRTIELMLGSRVAIATLWGPDSVLLYNDACARLTGADHPRILGMPVRRALPGMVAVIDKVMARVRAGETVFLCEQRIAAGSPDGAIWLDLCCSPILDAGGAIDGVFCTIRDITAAVLERREVELSLRQAQKMEAIGQLTGGIAHDFNNLLSGIIGNLELLATRLDQGNIASAVSYLEGARSAARRAAGLTRRLLAFSRGQAPAPDKVSVPALLADLDDLISHTVGGAIEVKVGWAPDVWSVFCDRNQLEHALLNLAINARDAMPGGGTLTLNATNATLGQPRRAGSYTPGEYVMLEIADTGTGMSPDVIDRVFDPFFTTKPEGKGTGLGLSMVYGFVKRSAGHINLRSQPGRGTTIRLYLPRHSGETRDAAPDSEALGGEERGTA